ncbi:MAG: LarC family nickel insertion protein [Candidatus Omnitrophica bacterium]|nr:LarC family nickel insertion protein [Candidatus Omnitrophota bacterium]
MRIAYLDCFSGISGDMTIAAFLDAGLDLKILKRELKKLKLTGYKIKAEKVKRGGLAGTKFDCIVKGRNQPHRFLNNILELIDESTLKKRVKDIAKKIFLTIGHAEAKVHGLTKKDRIEFHEVGDVDSIIDIVGSAIAIDGLDIDRVYASTLNFGRTFAKSRHGTIPIPGPAALEILKNVPSQIIDIDAELVTPTGAAIVKTLSKSFGRMPLMKISDIGYGAGTKVIKEIPNMLRIVIGKTND